jgi:hypothetical protein
MRAVVVLLAIAACTYADPIDGDGFKCDDDHACLDGQTCIAGACRTGVGLLFFDGWENRTELGCDQNALVDRDYNTAPPVDTGFLTTPDFPALCTNSNGSPDAEVVEDIGPTGVQTRMLRVRQANHAGSGTEFSVDKTVSAPQTDFYAAWSVKYSPDWQWAAADSGIFIIGDAPTVVEFGVEGRNDGSPAFVRIHVTAVDARFDATVGQMSVGVWHLCELHIVSGPHGKIEARVDHEPVPFPALNESNASILDIDVGPMIARGQIDTAYNDGVFVMDHMTSPWFAYYDDVRMGAGIGFEP